MIPTPDYESQGRPPKGASPTHYTYQVQATLVSHPTALAAARTKAGRFILATNRLQLEVIERLEPRVHRDPTEEMAPPPGTTLGQTGQTWGFNEALWPHDEILNEYKNQQSCERGFRFIKDPLFFLSRVFLKKPQRVAALAMVMGLCLRVYSLGQRQLRQALAATEETIPNQKGTPTVRPTLRWVLQCFQAVHLVWVDGCKRMIKLTAGQRHILRFFGAACQQYYFLC